MRAASPRGRLFRQVYAGMVATGLLFASLLAVARWLEPSRHPSRAEAEGPAHLLATHWLLVLLVLLAASAVAAYPLARRLTRRLERLQERVEQLGAGRLDVRVEVEGDDEVAALARSFAAAALRIESLLRAQRQLLANVSHELRTPLARLRVAVELLEREPGAAARARMIEDVAELDQLIGELLVASRLESGAPLERSEPVDLLALLAEEAARTGAEVAGQPVRVEGDPLLLRRLVRNLLENARQHGGVGAVEAELVADGEGAWLRVRDRGAGVPAEERERVFEPFHRVPGAGAGGSGLGLALVRQIARRHGGDAQCSARDGGGAEFAVRLPAASRP